MRVARAARYRIPSLGVAVLLLGLDAALAQPVPSAAERAAAFPDLGGMEARAMMIEDPFETYVRFDQLEVGDGDQQSRWDFNAWAGRDFDKLLVRGAGERDAGHTEHSEVDLLWAHAIAPWWDLVTGVRHETAPGPAQTWAAVGVQGFAPYAFEVEATALFGDGGRAGFTLEAEYDLLLTQRLILQPLAELALYTRDDFERGLGSGLSSLEIGLRLRYEIRREIAPYLGIVRSRAFGQTADLLRASGGEATATQWVAGLRFWF